MTGYIQRIAEEAEEAAKPDWQTLLTEIQQRADARDAKRLRFLAEHWRSLMDGVQLHLWIDQQALHRGGVVSALDYAMDYHYKTERHIA